MKFPTMNKRPRQAVVVPELSGGLNLRDSVSMINDNQLTDCKNVWFKDGVLKTRPGISDVIYQAGIGNYEGRMRAHDIYRGESKLFSCYDSENKSVDFYWVSDAFISGSGGFPCEAGNYVVTQKDDILYGYSSSGIYKCEDLYVWEEVTAHQMHTPLLMINCKYDYNGITGDMYESFNMLTPYYKVQYKFDVNCKTRLEFVLPYECEPEDLEVEVEYDNFDYSKETNYAQKPKRYHRAGEYEKSGAPTDKLVLVPSKNNKKRFHLVALSEYMNPDITSEIPGAIIYKRKIYNFQSDQFSENGYMQEEGTGKLHTVTITAAYRNADFEKNRNKVLRMSFGTWFGGDSAGINGGTRLFLGGNTAEPNLVVWSDLNNPLYFPENNYFYVGESNSFVTAFAKQSDMLVIFKENEIYFAQYNRNTNISAENIINQSVVDYVSSSVYFPLVLINSGIGCDCPDTIQLCRNRLVWACSDGKVYTLVSNNQYSERNIFEIGEMVYRKLRKQTNLKYAHSADWNGYYILQVGKDAYVLDYNSYGYQYVSSYSKNEDANLRIPWYYWEFENLDGGASTLIITTVNGNLKAITGFENGIFAGEISADCDTDYSAIALATQPIHSNFSTKLFEFGAQGYRKNVDKVILSLGNNGGEPIKVELITDEGSEEEYVTLEGEETKAYSPGYVKSVPLNPCIRSVERFGVKLSCEGPLAVDGITLFYRVLGGVK